MVFPVLWGIVNNAGIGGTVGGPPEWLPIKEFWRLLDVNTMGTIRVSLATLPFLKASKGRIVNMASVAGRLGGPTLLPYCISKAAVEMFSDGLG